MTETNAEQLERIKTRHESEELYWNTGTEMNMGILEDSYESFEDIDFLIERAERAQALEDGFLGKILARVIVEKREFRDENKRLHERIAAYQMKYENSGSIFSRRNQLDKIEGVVKENKKLHEMLNAEELTKKIRRWAIHHDLDTADPNKQMLKLMEEVGELSAAMARSDEWETTDAIGDIFVVLTILSMQLGYDIEGCISNAYDEIKDRKGEMVNGVFVKEDDLPKGPTGHYPFKRSKYDS